MWLSARSVHDLRGTMRPPNNAMQLTKGGWMRVEGAIVGNGPIVNQGKVVRPSQLIASVRQPTLGWRRRHSSVGEPKETRGSSTGRRLRI